MGGHAREFHHGGTGAKRINGNDFQSGKTRPCTAIMVVSLTLASSAFFMAVAGASLHEDKIGRASSGGDYDLEGGASIGVSPETLVSGEFSLTGHIGGWFAPDSVATPPNTARDWMLYN